MATVSLTINFPFIVPPAHFAVRYRPVGTTSWVSIPDQTNLPFTVPGITPGQYEFGISYVDADGESCAEVLYPFTVVDACDCFTVSGPKVQRLVAGGPAYIVIPYTGTTSALCGVIVKYAQAGFPDPSLITKAQVRLNPVPASPIMVPVPQLYPQDIEVLTDCCDGNVQECYAATIPADPEPAAGCFPITTANTSFQIVQSASTGQYYLNMLVLALPAPSLCNGMYVKANQIRIMFPPRGTTDMVTAYTPPSSFVPIAGGVALATKIAINPNPNTDNQGIRYNIQVYDCCGNMVSPFISAFTGVQIP